MFVLTFLRSSPLLLLAVVLTACSTILGPTPTETSPVSTEGLTDTEATEPSQRECVRVTGGIEAVDTGEAATDALFLSGELFICADDVVVVGEADLNELAAGAQLAAALGGPVLFPHARLAAEIGRLKPRRVHLVGEVDVITPPEAEVLRHGITDAVEEARTALGVSQEVNLPAIPNASTIVETVRAITDRDRVVLPQAKPSSSTSSVGPGIDVADLVTGLAIPTESESIWMIDAADPVTILMASATGRSVGASVVAIDGQDVLGYPEVSRALTGHPANAIRFVGGTPEAGEWELAVLANGRQVPGGGFYVLPREGKRRYVAFYGHPQTPALGVLGEQGPEETLTRMQPFLDAYAGDGSQTIPTFEIIVSVASGGATDDGDYSFEWPIETFDPWVEEAEANDVYVILDLQSGRDDFLTQARIYEEMLKLPFVGLALDPEWRLQPDEVHLRQTGSVNAAEVNEVIHWLADLVRDNGLPQKMIIVHQFRTTMIQDRETLEERPELQLIIQMDGDGTEAQKDNTYARLQEGADNAHWSWGWKNFFDEDEPGPPSPESTMSKDPVPVYVSYQ